ARAYTVLSAAGGRARCGRRGRVRLSSLAGQRGRRRRGRRRHGLEPGAGLGRRQERCVPARRLRPDAMGSSLSRRGLGLHQPIGCRPTVSLLPATISPQTSTRSRSAGAWKAAIASPPPMAGSRPTRRSRRRAFTRRATARPTSTPAGFRLAFIYPTPPIPPARWGGASTAPCCPHPPPPPPHPARGAAG